MPAREATLRLKQNALDADPSAMRPLARIAAVFLLAAGLTSLAHAEIYRWTDAQGRVHFTQDLSRVPASQRAAAEQSARAETQNAAPAALARIAPQRVRAGRPIEIPFEKHGNAMLVYVRLNDAVTAPFLVDTGASDVVVPAHVARAAGITVGRDTPRQIYQTANGMIESPIVALASVEVGDARVENLRGSLSEGMSVGLLGATFFNNYTFQIDPAANLITLHPNDRVRGGANQNEWRERFRALRRDLGALDAHLAGPPQLDGGVARRLAGRRAELAAALEALDAEANSADVPQAWRD